MYVGPPALRVNIMKNITNSSIVVQWDAVDDSLHTTYAIAWTNDRDLLEVDTVDEDTSYTITGLTLDTVYTITVTAANRCGGGPEFEISVSLSTDTTSATSTISPTVTASITIISTTNPSSTTAAVTGSSAINTTVTTVINSYIVITTTTTTYPSTTITNMFDSPIPTDTSTGGETSKFSNLPNMIAKYLLPTLP